MPFGIEMDRLLLPDRADLVDAFLFSAPEPETFLVRTAVPPISAKTAGPPTAPEPPLTWDAPGDSVCDQGICGCCVWMGVINGFAIGSTICPGA